VSVSVSIYCSTLLPCHGCASEQRGLKQWALSLPSGTDRRPHDSECIGNAMADLNRPTSDHLPMPLQHVLVWCGGHANPGTREKLQRTSLINPEEFSILWAAG
jgi:hypothetical protein